MIVFSPLCRWKEALSAIDANIACTYLLNKSGQM